MYQINRIFLFVLITFIGSKLNSQNKLYFDHLTTKNGLSQNDVNCIYQDQQGFLWFGTHDGLNKYDGYEFKTYNLDPNDENSINSNLIFSIAGDKNDNLWIGTSDKGINYFDKNLQKFAAFEHDENNPSSLSDNRVIFVFVDSKERLWVSCGQRVDWVDLKKGLTNVEFNHIKFNDTYRARVSSIYEDTNGVIWAAGDTGLFKLEENKSPYFKKITSKNINVRSVTQYKNSIIYSSNKAIFSISLSDPNYVINKLIDTDNYNSVGNLLVNDNRLWAGSYNGLYIFEFLENKLVLKNNILYQPSEKNGLSKNIVTSLYKDQTNLIWIGTNGGGVNKYNPQRKSFLHIKNSATVGSLSYDKIRAIHEDSNGNLWIGTEGGALNMLPKKNEQDHHDFKQLSKYSNIVTIKEIIRNKKTSY